MKQVWTKLRRAHRGGVNRAVAILLALIAVMLVVIAVPAWRVFKYRSQKTGCEQSMKSARDCLIIEFLSRWDAGSVEEAMVTLDEVLPARANICPAGGTVYLVRGDNGIFEPVCGMHDDDKKLRARLNASRARELLKEALRVARRDSEEEPESVEITLNGMPLECGRVQEPPDLKRGTGTTNGYQGIVAFYGLPGDGAFSVDGAGDGEIVFFIYADEYYCAIWHADEEWTGDAYT